MTTHLPHLNLEEFQQTFDEQVAKAQNRITKVERLQNYQEPGNPSFEAFARGDMNEARAKLLDTRASQAELYADLGHRNVAFVRLRAVEFPLTPYLQWEFLTYQVTARYGERILVTDISGAHCSPEAYSSPDFIVFDDRVATVLDYGDNGILQGAELVESTEGVQKLMKIAQELMAKSIPLASFERQHGLLYL